jgi:putative beta-lysine N-acetyltransferase
MEIMTDRTEKICGATIQHGPSNNRIYLMKQGPADPCQLIPALNALVAQHGYTKIFAKVHAAQAPAFLQAGYEKEAAIPGFYQGKDDAVFLCRYPDPARKIEEDPAELNRNLELALKKQGGGINRALQPGAILRPCLESDADAMAELYATVFPSYPFPIHEPDYLIETMRTHVAYFGIEVDGKLVALSSAEMDRNGQNAEMTDFATHPDWLGNGFAAHLLAAMEPAIAQLGIKTAYTIARAASPGMNTTFARLGYIYGGRLINNTQISGRIESMNVWHKSL